MDVREETTDAAEMQQWNKELRSDMSRNQGKCQQGTETDHRAGDHKASSRVFFLDSRNEGRGNVEELANVQAKGGTTRSVRAGRI
jgi:hypothetical protein